MKYPAECGGPAELEVKGSRFIGFVFPVKNREEAGARVEELREANPGAAHVVWAFRAGRTMPLDEGFSDDGEPSGTGGKPLRSLLEGRDVTDGLAAVVRYFGGTKLGTGGLVRAYAEVGRRVLGATRLRDFRRLVRFEASLEYRFHESLERFLGEAGGRLEGREFSDRVTVRGTVPAEAWEGLDRRMEELCGGAWLGKREELWG